MKKTISVVSIIMIAAFFAATFSYAGGFDKSYYANHPTSVEKLTKIYGTPIAKKALEDGTSKVVFHNSGNTMGLADRYFIVKDGKVIDAGLQ